MGGCCQGKSNNGECSYFSEHDGQFEIFYMHGKVHLMITNAVLHLLKMAR